MNGLKCPEESIQKTIEYIEKKNIGSKKINFRLKDWGISRQRYWGCPIPIAYNKDNQIIKIPLDDLPVKLPENIDLNKKGNPLDENDNWKNIMINGEECVRETDTLDTFVDSSWYFLRFCSAKNEDKPFDDSETDYWMPVDQYIGGVEHAILHLLYSRFFMRAISHKNKNFKLDEPFSGFDPVNVDLIKQELIEMKSTGKAVMISTHNMKSVEEICDRAVLIHNSKNIKEGTIHELQTERNSGLYAVRFQGNMIAFVNALWTGFEVQDKEVLGENRFIVRLKMRGDSSFEDLLKVIIGQVKIEAAWEVLPSMEDIFIDLVNSNKLESNEE
mgnify:CR=1 FL=1